MSETKEGLKKRFLKWRSVLESKRLKVNLEKTKTMVFGSEGEVMQSRIDSCEICGKRVTVNSLSMGRSVPQIRAFCCQGGEIYPIDFLFAPHA